MASIIPGYEYDIFISYRQKDNRSDKWVSIFVKALHEELDATFKEDISIYFDENPHDGLLETHHVNKSLEGKLKCLIFIPIISQTYCDPKSFAWQHEFCAFNKLTKVDQFGRDIKLSNGNVASRILPVKIHDLDVEDKVILESELGSVLRPIEFIFRSPGVNRPLTSKDDDAKEITHTLFYRDQINKLANAIKELLYALKFKATTLKPDDSIDLRQVQRVNKLQVRETVSRQTNPSAGSNHPNEFVSASNIPERGKRFLTRRNFLMIASALLVITVITYLGNEIRKRLVGDSLIVKIEKLRHEIEELSSIERGIKAWEAYQLVKQVEGFPARKPELIKTWLPISRTFRIKTDPPSAKVYIKPYSTPTADWSLIGTSPIDSIRLPFGSFRIKIENEGYATQEDAIADRLVYDPFGEVNLNYSLLESSQVPEGMVLVKGDTVDWYNGRNALSDYFIDRFEVTNKSYKQFIDAGGYEQEKFWKYEFKKEGKLMPWVDAMALFVDKTGRPGPSDWIAGSYPKGKEDYPVGGVSWYEAAAYAEFAGKTLPTIIHFRHLSMPWANAEILNLSNINGSGSKPVGSTAGMTRSGTYDLAGNVREWVFNAIQQTGNRIIPGGAWSDDQQVYGSDYDVSPFDRNEINGFRCMKSRDELPVSESLTAPVVNFKFDMSKRKAITFEQFELMKRLYDYEPTAVRARIEYRKDEGEWFKEKISFLPAYGKDSMSVYLFLPKNAKPPYQTVIYFPGSGAFTPIPSEQLLDRTRWDGIRSFEYLLKTGRAVLFPVYYGTMDRYDPIIEQGPNFIKPRQGLTINRDRLIKQGKDFRRSVDYLQTRGDIDTEKLAYYGYSQGGGEGGVILAIESRIKTAVLVVCGLSTRIEVLPEADRANYLPYINQPVLMLNSFYDWNYPYDISQKPFFDLLGTPEEHKKLILYKESGHQIPWNSVVKESLNWYDYYLGKVNHLPVTTTGG
jgi:formylglycine-generating enzyme required for sulfatase activity/dienelactone hydrolase